MAEEGCRDPAGESLADPGHHRQPRPERIARRRVRIVGQGIEEQIGDAMTRQMIVRRSSAGKDEPIRSDAAVFRFPPQIANRAGIVLEQPQHAAFDVTEKPHPDVEHGGDDLVIVVEAAEHEAGLRQPGLRPRRRPALTRRFESFGW